MFRAKSQPHLTSKDVVRRQHCGRGKYTERCSLMDRCGAVIKLGLGGGGEIFPEREVHRNV